MEEEPKSLNLFNGLAKEMIHRYFVSEEQQHKLKRRSRGKDLVGVLG